MIELKSIISPLTKGIKIAYDKFRSPEKAYINKVITELNGSIKLHQEYLKNIINRPTHLSFDDIKKYIYWDEEKVKQFIRFKLTTDPQFHFPNEECETFVDELKEFFVIEDNNLSEQDFIAILKRVITTAQEQFKNNSTTDPKLMNYILLRKPTPISKDEIDVYMIEIVKKLNKIDSKLVHIENPEKEEQSFIDWYNKCIALYENKLDNECLVEIDKLKDSLEVTNVQEQSLEILKICIAYRQFHYDKAYILVKQLEEELDEDILFYFLGIKGAVISEQGESCKSKALIKQAIDTFEKQLDLLTEETEGFLVSILYNLGTSYLNLGQSIEDIKIAIHYFEEAVEINPSEAQTLKNLGTAYGYLGEIEKEVECYNRALEINSNLFEALCAKSWTLLNYDHNIEDSINCYKKALTHKERLLHFPTIYYWLSIGYLHQEALDVALISIDKGLDIEPDNYHLLWLKIDLLHKLVNDNPERYLPILQNLLDEKQDELNVELYIKIANIFLTLKHLNDCKAIIDKLLDMGKESEIADLLLLYVFYCYDIDKDQLQIAEVRQYFNLICPKNIVNYKLKSPYYFIESQIWIADKEYDKSIDSYQKILEINDGTFKDENVYSLMGESYAKKEDFENSRKFYLKARSSAPDPLFDIERGIFEACIHLGRKNCAYTTFYRMLDIVEIISSSLLLQKEKKITDDFERVFSTIIECSFKLAAVKAVIETANIENKDKKTETFERLMESYGDQYIKDITKRLIPTPNKSYQIFDKIIKQKINEIKQAK
jgi:tetratricopeptide (TPR) repeat protein